MSLLNPSSVVYHRPVSMELLHSKLSKLTSRFLGAGPELVHYRPGMHYIPVPRDKTRQSDLILRQGFRF